MTDKHQQLRRYFSKPWQPYVAATLFLVGLFVALLGTESLRWGDPSAMLIGLALIVLGGVWFFRVFRHSSGPTDAQVDEWLDADINALIPKGLSRSDLEEQELVSDPLVVRGPIYWETSGIQPKDILYKKGKDGVARFSAYDVTIIFLTDQRLTAYRCDFNFLKTVALNEATTEYYYQDVVSVSTREISTSYTLPNKQKLVSAQAFSVQVPSGDAIKVVVSASKLEELTGAQMPPTGADNAVSVIRTMLRSKKGVVRMSQ